MPPTDVIGDTIKAFYRKALKLASLPINNDDDDVDDDDDDDDTSSASSGSGAEDSDSLALSDVRISELFYVIQTVNDHCDWVKKFGPAVTSRYTSGHKAKLYSSFHGDKDPNSTDGDANETTGVDGDIKLWYVFDSIEHPASSIFVDKAYELYQMILKIYAPKMPPFTASVTEKNVLYVRFESDPTLGRRTIGGVSNRLVITYENSPVTHTIPLPFTKLGDTLTTSPAFNTALNSTTRGNSLGNLDYVTDPTVRRRKYLPQLTTSAERVLQRSKEWREMAALLTTMLQEEHVTAIAEGSTSSESTFNLLARNTPTFKTLTQTSKGQSLLDLSFLRKRFLDLRESVIEPTVQASVFDGTDAVMTTIAKPISIKTTTLPKCLRGEYKLGPIIGEGVCGVVLKGTHVKTGEPVAIKFLKHSEVHVPSIPDEVFMSKYLHSLGIGPKLYEYIKCKVDGQDTYIIIKGLVKGASLYTIVDRLKREVTKLGVANIADKQVAKLRAELSSFEKKFADLDAVMKENDIIASDLHGDNLFVEEGTGKLLIIDAGNMTHPSILENYKKQLTTIASVDRFTEMLSPTVDENVLSVAAFKLLQKILENNSK